MHPFNKIFEVHTHNFIKIIPHLNRHLIFLLIIKQLITNDKNSLLKIIFYEILIVNYLKLVARYEEKPIS